MQRTMSQQIAPIIYVDADACPVKPEVLKVAERHGFKTVFVANSGLRPSRDPMVVNVIVSAGFDAADNWIAEHAGDHDIVITADVPLAVRCVDKGALVTGPQAASSTAPISAWHPPCATSASTCAKPAKARAIMPPSARAIARPSSKRSTGSAGGQNPNDRNK